MSKCVLPQSLPRLEADMLCEWWEERDMEGNIIARNLTNWSEFAFHGSRFVAGRKFFRREMIRRAGGGGNIWLRWRMAATREQKADLWNATAIALGYAVAGGVLVLSAVSAIVA